MNAPQPPVVRNRSRFRRPVWIILGICAALFVSWIGYGYWQDWADAKAWREYLTDLEWREPNWRERVYGRPATSEEEVLRKQLMQFNMTIAGTNQAWGPYRSSLYGGFLQDPEQPAARLTVDQHEFLQWTNQVMKPFLDQASSIDDWVSLNVHFPPDLPFEKMTSQGVSDSGFLYTVNEIAELQALYWMQENRPEEAALWIRRCIKLQNMRRVQPFFGYFGPCNSLIERWLNLTEPSEASLAAIQHGLEHLQSQGSTFKKIGYHCRLLEAQVLSIHHGEMTPVQMDQYRFFFFRADSLWNERWCRPLREYYLRYKFARLFRRANHLRLRLHQLADRLERLATIPAGSAWQEWSTFAKENLPGRLEYYPLEFKATDVFPEGLCFILPNLAESMPYYIDQEVETDAALGCIASERFRRVHGRLPESWTDLVPRFLTSVPLDPYTGRPLVLKPIDKGMVVYSLGRDGKDDGGKKLTHTNFWHYGGRNRRLEKEGDVGFRLYLPAHRRSSPLELEEEQIKAINSWRSFKP